jgi:hypothetical protein
MSQISKTFLGDEIPSRQLEWDEAMCLAEVRNVIDLLV